MVKLIVDDGNTLTKVALFNEDKLLEILSIKKGIQDAIQKLFNDYEPAFSGIISSVRNSTTDIEHILAETGVQKIVTMRSGLRLPVRVHYKTPETLGSDRLANACAAIQLFPVSDILIIDTGTCIKYELVTSEGSYIGGSISPGLKMRYKALGKFTDKLPYLKPANEIPALTGQSTEGSIRSGVENGMLAEINGMIEWYTDEYKSIKVILTGGDQVRFADKLKSPIFVAQNLTINGLKVILDHNDH